MQSQISHTDAPSSSNCNPDPVPPDVLVDLARSLLIDYRRIIFAQAKQIELLETRLALAAAAWRPANSVLQ